MCFDVMCVSGGREMDLVRLGSSCLDGGKTWNMVQRLVFSMLSFDVIPLFCFFFEYVLWALFILYSLLFQCGGSGVVPKRLDSVSKLVLRLSIWRRSSLPTWWFDRESAEKDETKWKDKSEERGRCWWLLLWHSHYVVVWLRISGFTAKTAKKK